MKKEQTPLKKWLKQYALMASPLLAIAQVASGQIIYTDIDPDYILTDSTSGIGGNVLPFDLDNDGVSDYRFIVSYRLQGGPGDFNLEGALPYAGNGNGVMGYANGPFSTFEYPSALSAGAAINANGNFWSHSLALGVLLWYYIPSSGSGGTMGQWSNATDKYMGIHFHGGDGNMHYGWIRMDVENNPPAIIIKDYAYESQNEIGINAGNVPTAVPALNDNNDITIVSFEKSVYISAPATSNDPMVVRVTDLMGQTLIEQSSTENNLRLNLRDLASSLYLVRVQKGALTKSAKVSLR